MKNNKLFVYNNSEGDLFLFLLLVSSFMLITAFFVDLSGSFASNLSKGQSSQSRESLKTKKDIGIGFGFSGEPKVLPDVRFGETSTWQDGKKSLSVNKSELNYSKDIVVGKLPNSNLDYYRGPAERALKQLGLWDDNLTYNASRSKFLKLEDNNYEETDKFEEAQFVRIGFDSAGAQTSLDTSENNTPNASVYLDSSLEAVKLRYKFKAGVVEL